MDNFNTDYTSLLLQTPYYDSFNKQSSVDTISKENYNSHTVSKGESLSSIAKKYNTTVEEIAKENNIKDVNKIYLNQNLVIPIKNNVSSVNNEVITKKSGKESIKDIWRKEEELNKDNISAIQGVQHSSNYVIIDKSTGTLKVYNSDNKEIYKGKVKTGATGNDYNTITYTDSQGRILNKKGNNSTPAGITMISSISEYHGVPAFQRSRYNSNTGKFDDNIASSFHYGNTQQTHGSNGCVNIGPKTLKDLEKYIGVGTMVYTLPEQKGSRFTISEGRLNFTADDPYGDDTKGNPKRFWDDYNVYSDRTYNPMHLEYTGTDKYKRDGREQSYRENISMYLKSLEENKEQIMNDFNISSETYNKLALLATGIAEQETQYGMSTKKKIKDLISDETLATIKRIRDGGEKNYNRSYGITQMKILNDNNGMRKKYQDNMITPESLNDVSTAAKATMLRLAYMFNTEVRGRKYTNNKGETINPYDALLYKWMGKNHELKNKTATPELNTYIKNIKSFIEKINIYQ